MATPLPKREDTASAQTSIPNSANPSGAITAPTGKLTSEIPQNGLGCSSMHNNTLTWFACPQSAGTSVTNPNQGASTTATSSAAATDGLIAPPNSLKPSQQGLSGGAVAGVAIGCLLVGAAIGAVILLFFSRRRRASQTVTIQHHIPYNAGSSTVEKGPVVMTTAVASSIDHLLPQPVADDDITKELSRLRDNIKNHVRTYYHTHAVGTVDVRESQLGSLASATGLGSSALLRLILNPSKRGDALRLLISWELFSRCDGSKHPSLLSNELAPLTAALAGNEGRNPALYSKWKTVTGVLLQQQQSKRSSLRSQGAEEATAQLESVLAHFVQVTTDEGQRQKNLEMILNRAASLAVLLFAQPGSFRFDFAAERGSLVVFPSAYQVISDQAQPLNPPRLLWEKEIATEVRL